jgi:hypothetical protein
VCFDGSVLVFTDIEASSEKTEVRDLKKIVISKSTKIK